MSGILIYSQFEAKRNKFAVDKFKELLGVRLMLSEELDYTAPADFVINRTNNAAIAYRFESRGIRVFNPSSLTALANNKQKCYEYMARSGIEIMPINYKGAPVVKKAVNGKGGTQVFMLENAEPFESGYVYQKPSSDLGKDLRVWLIADKIICSVLRQSKGDFRSNFCLGGSATVYELTAEERSLVYKIASLIHYDYVGIDFVFNNGRLVFNEIEDSVGARMVYDQTDIDIIGLYCEYIKKQLGIA